MSDTKISYHVMFADTLKKEGNTGGQKTKLIFFGQKIVNFRSTKGISFFQTGKRKLKIHGPTATPEFSNL